MILAFKMRKHLEIGHHGLIAQKRVLMTIIGYHIGEGRGRVTHIVISHTASKNSFALIYQRVKKV